MKYIIRILFLCFLSYSNAQSNLDTILNNWHKYAAIANIEEYFNLMDDQFVFMGTAPGERWNKKDFFEFCNPYFERKKTWNFTPSNRYWQYNQDSTVAWFDEDLNTWMGGCRGSGILIQNQEENWQLIFYNLSVLIENEKMKSFIRLRKKN